MKLSPIDHQHFSSGRFSPAKPVDMSQLWPYKLTAKMGGLEFPRWSVDISCVLDIKRFANAGDPWVADLSLYYYRSAAERSKVQITSRQTDIWSEQYWGIPVVRKLENSWVYRP